MRRITATKAWLLLLAVCLALAGCREGIDVSGHPNIVLITLDTTRADHLGAYGYFRDTSPRIDAFAEQSIVFEHAIAPMATTLPTHVSILTATHPLEHGVLANVMHGGRRFVPAAGLRSFATVCREQGYRTAAFVSAAPLKRDSGIQLGFEVFDEPDESEAERSGGQTSDAALRWLAGLEAGPFLLWVHYYDAHWPFAAPAPFGGRYRTDPSPGALHRRAPHRRGLLAGGGGTRGGAPHLERLRRGAPLPGFPGRPSARRARGPAATGIGRRWCSSATMARGSRSTGTPPTAAPGTSSFARRS